MSAPIKLVISDVDGTLVTPDKVLTPAAEAAIGKLRAAGAAFTIISGRPPRGMARLIGQLHIDLPVSAFNGGSLVNPDLSVIEAVRLPEAVAREAIGLLDRLGVQVWVYADNDWFVRDLKGERIDHESVTIAFAPTLVADFEALMTRVDKIVGVSDDNALMDKAEAETQKLLAGKATALRSQPYYLDITHPDANKAHAVRAFGQRLGVPLENIAVIGDMANDISMLALTGIGLSIAMGQSSAAVKAAAQEVTKANTDDGFAAAVDTYILPRITG
jgi:Cof subfamily protein (haloacid dehalogenase superfamily)